MRDEHKVISLDPASGTFTIVHITVMRRQSDSAALTKQSAFTYDYYT
jgi:hypothetical protein